MYRKCKFCYFKNSPIKKFYHLYIYFDSFWFPKLPIMVEGFSIVCHIYRHNLSVSCSIPHGRIATHVASIATHVASIATLCGEHGNPCDGHSNLRGEHSNPRDGHSNLRGKHQATHMASIATHIATSSVLQGGRHILSLKMAANGQIFLPFSSSFVTRLF
jgi:hypothetical protein